jgi:hypothetical protein
VRKKSREEGWNLWISGGLSEVWYVRLMRLHAGCLGVTWIFWRDGRTGEEAFGVHAAI